MLNVGRLCSLYWVLVYAPRAFDTVHLELWPIALLLAAAGLLLEMGSVVRAAKHLGPLVPPWRFVMLLATTLGLGLHWLGAPTVVDARSLYTVGVVYASLVVSTAVWKPDRVRRLLLVGVPAVMCLCALKVGIAMSYAWAENASALARAPLIAANLTLNGLPAMTFAMPSLLWLAVLRWPCKIS